VNVVRGLLLGVALFIPIAAYADGEGVGHVQVRALPGVNVELDGKIRGITEGEDGFVFRDVPQGPHRIEAWMSGYERQYGFILVEAGRVAVHRLRPFQPSPPNEQVAKGAVMIETLPVHATIDAKKLGWRKIPKEEEPFIAAGVPKGRHKMTFCNAVKCMDYNAEVPANDVLSILVDFDPGQILDVTKEHKAAWAGWRARCEREGDREACRRACMIDSALTGNVHAPSCERFNVDANALASVEASSTLTPPCNPAQGARSGFVSVVTEPDAEVYVGEKKLGNTPIAKLAVPAGCVELHLINREAGVDRRLRVEVEPDQVSSVKLDLVTRRRTGS
jgi:hypothetical protein